MTDNITIYKLFNVDKNKLERFLKNKNAQYNLTENLLDYKLTIMFGYKNNEDFFKDFLSEFKSYIYADKDISLENRLVEILKIRNLKIAVGESFTGGNISSKIVSISGASSVFYEGVVAYSNESKIKRLNVKDESLKKFNPVSKEVCYEMCKGLLEDGEVSLAISSTGIAGPNSDDSNFPVGLCYLGVGSSKKIEVNKYVFKGTREQITKLGVDTALFLGIRALINGSFDV